MSRKLSLIGVFAVGLIGGATALAYPSHKPTVIQEGNLVIRANGGISPSALPRNKTTPITVTTRGSVSTLDGSHLPAAKTVVVDIDKSFAINTKGLPVCRESEIVARSTIAATRACRDAIVGHGSAEAEVAFPEQAPFMARGPLLFFNGGTKGGVSLLLIHLYAPVPAPTAIVTAVEITRIHKGHYGHRAVAHIPPIAGGSGSIAKFKFMIDRKFIYRGRRNGFLEAKCPTGTYFTEILASFREGVSLRGTVIRPCLPKGSKGLYSSG